MKMYEDQLIVVTGGAGFIGSHVVRCLNAKGYTNLVIFDHLGTSEKWKNLVGKRFVDLLPKESCLDWLQGKEQTIGAFIHLGACSSTVETDASYLLENNYRFSVRLAEYAIKNDKRFIYASSAATYGNGELGFKEDNFEHLKPLNMYGFSKQLFDLWLNNQGLLDKVVGLKYFNVFGPNEYHKGRMASALLHLMPIAQRERVVKLFKSSEPEKYKDGEQKRDFIYVDDAARMTCAFLENGATGLYNIGSGMASSWNYLATCLFKALDLPVNIEYIPMPGDLVGKYQNFSQADMTKTEKTLQGLASCKPLEAAIKEYVQNYLLAGRTW